MLIYAEKITPRLQYIAEVLLGECGFTSSVSEFYESDTIKINYSARRFSDSEFFIAPCGLLAENSIKHQKIVITKWQELKVFFAVKGDIPFDIFSAAFYLLSRYEEYLPHQKDSYGRFAHTESLAWKEGFLDQPLVDQWKMKFYAALNEKFPSFQLRQATFAFIPTYDIDIAFAGGRGVLKSIIDRVRGITSRVNGRDKFDVYDWLDELHVQHSLSPIYFFLLAQRRGKYDKNLSPRSRRLQQLVRHIASKYCTGIHPSWQSYYDEEALRNEADFLARTTNQVITRSRQHYIQFTLPRTFRQLIQAGIHDEYSMGYGGVNGFRASTATPYLWYDLMKEEKTTLFLHPFCFMEANSFFEQKLTAEEAAHELDHYWRVVKSVNGELVTIFHNHFLTEEEQWQPWRRMYAEFIAKHFHSSKITSPSLQEQS